MVQTRGKDYKLLTPEVLGVNELLCNPALFLCAKFHLLGGKSPMLGELHEGNNLEIMGKWYSQFSRFQGLRIWIKGIQSDLY